MVSYDKKASARQQLGCKNRCVDALQRGGWDMLQSDKAMLLDMRVAAPQSCRGLENVMPARNFLFPGAAW
jgi:hypothetical protein